MAKTFTSPFAQTCKVGTAVSTAACVIGSADAPTNTSLLVPTNTEDVIVTGISAISRGTITASALYLFVSNDGGVTKRLVDAVTMPAYTLQTNSAPNRLDFVKYSEQTPFRLNAGDSLYVASAVAAASGIVFKAEYTVF